MNRAGDRWPRFSDAEYARRYKLIRAEMDRRDFKALVIWGDAGHSRYNQANVHYVSNWVDQMYSYVVFPRHADPTLFVCLHPHVVNARHTSVVEDVRWGGFTMAEGVAARLKEIGITSGRVGLVGANSRNAISLPLEHYQILTTALPDVHFELCTELLEEIRLIKSDEEISALEKGCELTDLALRALVEHVRPGVREVELEAEIMYAYLKVGGKYHFQLLGSTPQAEPEMCYPWHLPSNRAIERGDLIITEISAGFNYYSGQIIRAISVGEPRPEYVELYELTRRVYDDIVAALRPGNTHEDVLRAGRPLVDAGYKSQILIHGWGQNLQRPFVSIATRNAGRRWEEVVFQPGMVVMVEPNPITPDEKRGMFLGDLHLIENDGARRLQKSPLELIVVDV